MQRVIKRHDPCNMKNFFRLCMLLMIIPILLLTAGSVSAETACITDSYDLYTYAEEEKLEERCDEFYSETGYHIFIMTIGEAQMSSRSDSDTRAYIEDYGDAVYNGEGYIGMIINMNTRYVYVDVSGGDAESVWTDQKIDKILDAVWEDLSDGNYYDAAVTFVKKSQHWISADPNLALHIAMLLVSMGFGAVISLFLYRAQAAKHKEKKVATDADRYVINGALQLSLNKDQFVNQYVTRVPRSDNSSHHSGGGGGGHSSGHISSSGSSHHGGGRHF